MCFSTLLYFQGHYAKANPLSFNSTGRKPVAMGTCAAGLHIYQQQSSGHMLQSSGHMWQSSGHMLQS